DVYTIVAPVKLANLSALQIELLPHGSLPGKGPGRAKDGNAALSEIRCTLAPRDNPGAVTRLTLAEASADHAQEGTSAAAAIDGNLATAWAIAPRTGQDHIAVFEVQTAPAAGEAVLTIELVQNHGTSHNLGRFRLWATASPQPVRANQGIPEK